MRTNSLKEIRESFMISKTELSRKGKYIINHPDTDRAGETKQNGYKTKNPFGFRVKNFRKK